VDFQLSSAAFLYYFSPTYTHKYNNNNNNNNNNKEKAKRKQAVLALVYLILKRRAEKNRRLHPPAPAFASHNKGESQHDWQLSPFPLLYIRIVEAVEGWRSDRRRDEKKRSENEAETQFLLPPPLVAATLTQIDHLISIELQRREH